MLDRATASVRFLSGEREPVRVATTANIVLDGLQTIDGVALAVNDRVLVKDQTDQRLNGIYTASRGLWYRASDARFPRAIAEGVTVQVQEGAVHGGQAFRFRETPERIGVSDIIIDFYLSANFTEDAEEAIQNQLDRIQEDGNVIIGAAEDARDGAIEALVGAEAARDATAAFFPVGGSTGQVLAKASNADRDVQWVAAGNGDMISAAYDPAGYAVDVFGGQLHAPTRTAAMALTPVVAPSIIRTSGYSSAGDGGGALYKAVGSEPSHVGKISITLDDGVTVQWYELADEDVSPAKVGVLYSPNVAPAATYPIFSAGSGDQSAAMQAWLDAPGYKKIGGKRRTIRLDAGLIIPASNLDSRKIDLGNSMFDCSRFPSTLVKAFTANGVRGTQRPIGALASKGAMTVAITSGNQVGLQVGQMVRIGSNAIFDASSTNVRLGELNWIAGIGPGTTVSLKLPLRDTYIPADGAFLEEIVNAMPGFELLGGEFYGPEATTNNAYGVIAAFLDNPKVMGQQFHYFDYLGIAFQSCFRGEADIQMTKTRPNTTGYGVAFFDACLGGVAKGTFREVRHAASTNNQVASQWGVPRDVVFKDMHSLNSASALGGSMAGGAAFDAHTAAENISYIDCISQGSSGCALSIECPTATVRNFKAIDSQNSVSAILLQNKADRSGVYSLSGIQVDGSAGAGIRVQGGATFKCATDLVGFDIQRCTGHSIHLQDLAGGYVGDGTSRTSSGNRAISGSSMDRITVGPYTAIGGAYSTYFAGTVTNSMVIRGVDSSTTGVLLGAGAGNTQK